MTVIAKAALALGLLAGATLAQAQTYIGATLSGVLSPGVFGRIDIGNLGGLPPLISPQPVYVRPVYGVAPAPVYIYAPAYERTNWNRYCGNYGACGAPVYFVDVGPNGQWARPIGHYRPSPPPLRHVESPRHVRPDPRWDDRGHGSRWDDRGHGSRWEGRGHGPRWDDRPGRQWGDRHDRRGPPPGRGPDGRQGGHAIR